MSKDNRTKIEIVHEGKEYTLCYTADALRKMEKNYGINFNKLEDKMITATEDLFYGAFIANHNDVSRNKRAEIFKALSPTSEDEEGLIETLIEMIGEAVEEIKPSGNVKWKVSRKA